MCAGLTLTEDQIKNLALMDIENLLQMNGKSLEDYKGMPLPSNISVEGEEERLILEELNYDKRNMNDLLQQSLPSLNNEQRQAYDKIVQAVYSNKGGFFFVYGYGGTGKTFLWNTLSASIRSRGDIVINVASSGIASLLLPGGRTAHSRFKIPISIHENSTCSLKQGRAHAKLLIRAKLIIWDEAPMMHKWCFEALDRSLRDILQLSQPYYPNLPFGGKVVVLGGDFRQILPVVPRGSREDVVNATINSSYLWPFCRVLRLTKNMRLALGSSGLDASEVSEFSKWLLNIGDGTIGDQKDGEAEIQIPDELLIPNTASGFDDLINFTYPNMLTNMSTIGYFSERAILAPTVELVGKVNDYIMSRVSAEERVYLSSDSICKEDGNVESELNAFSPEVLNAINC